MIEQVPPRRSASKALRARVFQRDDGRCYLCKTKVVAGEPWELEHANQRALSHDDSERNLFVAHVSCHKVKTAKDAKDRAHVKRIIKKNAEPKAPSRLRSRGFDKTKTRKFSGEVVSRTT